MITRLVPPDHWVGFGRILHGGFQGMLLDEIMSWAVWGCSDERTFVTRSMTVEFHRPVRIGQELEIVGRLRGRDGRRLRTEGEVRDPSGARLTSSEGVIVAVERDRMNALT